MQLVQLPQTTSCSTDRHLETSFDVIYIRYGGGPLHQSGLHSRQRGSSGQLCITCSLLQTFLSACVCIKSAGSPKLPPPASQSVDDTAPTAWHPSADAPLVEEGCPTPLALQLCSQCTQPWNAHLFAVYAHQGVSCPAATRTFHSITAHDNSNPIAPAPTKAAHAIPTKM